MEAIALNKIREALRTGEKKGYRLFPEIRDKNCIAEARSHPVTKVMVKDIIELANQVKDNDPPTLPFKDFMEFLENGNRYHYEKKFFTSKNELHALVMAEILEGKGNYLEAIQERLWDWCNTYSWELPAHVPLTKDAVLAAGVGPDQTVALFSAESGFYFAEILSLLKEKLHPFLVYRLQQEIARRILKPYKENTYWWEEAKMNWASVCAGAVGCAAIYQIQDTNELAQIIYRIIGTLQGYLLGFDKEGVTTEGLGYWQYGFSFYVYFSQLLKERTCGELDLFGMDEKMNRIAELPAYLQFPDMQVIAFSDAPGDMWYGPYGLLAKLEQLFHVKNYLSPTPIDTFRDHTSKWALLSRNIFWTLAKKDFTPNKGYRGTKFFEGCQWFISRDYDANDNFACFAAKGGNNDEPHNHNDLGNFIFHYGKHTVLCDLGVPEYTKEYFGEKRYTFLNASSRGHSVPIINGQEQKQGKSAKAVVLAVNCQSLSSVRFELERAYQLSNLSSYTREFTWDKSNLHLHIEDSFQFSNGENYVEEVFMTHYPVEFQEHDILIHTPDYKLKISANDYDHCEVSTIPYSNHFGESVNVNQIKIRYNGIGKMQLIKIDAQIMN